MSEQKPLKKRREAAAAEVAAAEAEAGTTLRESEEDVLTVLWLDWALYGPQLWRRPPVV